MQILILILCIFTLGICSSVPTEKLCRTIKIINDKPEIFQTFCPSDQQLYEYLVNERVENVPDNGEIIDRLYGIIVSYDKVKVSKTNYFSQSLRMTYMNETHMSNGTITHQINTSHALSEPVFLTRNTTCGIFPGLQKGDHTGVIAFVTDGLVLYPHYGVQLYEPYSYSVSLGDQLLKQVFNITMRFYLYGELEGLLDHTEEIKETSISKLHGRYNLIINPENGLVIKNNISVIGSLHYFDGKTDDVHIAIKFQSKLISQTPKPLSFKDEL